MKTADKPLCIRTPRLVLRPFREEDAPAMTALLLSPEISKTYMLPDLTDPAAAGRLFIRLLMLSHQAEHFIYGIFLKDALIGFLNDVQIMEDSIELGYVIAPDHWNRGYATETLRACIDALFALGFSRVMAGYFYENDASRRVMEKSGMHPAWRTEEIEYRGEVRRCIYFEIGKPFLKELDVCQRKQ